MAGDQQYDLRGEIVRAFNAWTPDAKDREIATLRARVAELEAALIQCRGALRLDAMVDEDGQPYGTTEVALEAVRCALGEPDTPNMFRRSVNESPGGEHER